jgi:hypothetical protein
MFNACPVEETCFLEPYIMKYQECCLEIVCINTCIIKEACMFLPIHLWNTVNASMQKCYVLMLVYSWKLSVWTNTSMKYHKCCLCREDMFYACLLQETCLLEPVHPWNITYAVYVEMICSNARLLQETCTVRWNQTSMIGLKECASKGQPSKNIKLYCISNE